MQFAHDRGLQHIIIWELGHDLAPSNPNSLLLRAYNTNLSLTPVAGDYDGDHDVDGDDYTAWRNSLGQTGSGLAADGNGNQVVDAGDYVICARISRAPAAARWRMRWSLSRRAYGCSWCSARWRSSAVLSAAIGSRLCLAALAFSSEFRRFTLTTPRGQ